MRWDCHLYFTKDEISVKPTDVKHLYCIVRVQLVFESRKSDSRAHTFTLDFTLKLILHYLALIHCDG
jgi:hypothetical protein